ncbi:tyrosine-type recombinase/integrase [Rhodoplanes serenus]|uniref:Tyrosine-type recombinase/integrase n=2 Tax=Rhodoplanes serenus TaxID=200615 RepID=A0A9X4XMF4_9BRAD|nr:tyrosine-type recombinase/integrase [Rhodoplanes serenus]
MPDMPPARLPHLVRQVTRHGRVVWYVRIGHGPRVRLRASYGSPEFMAEYAAAVAAGAPASQAKPIAGTLGWLIDRYRETAAWSGLSLATRRQREAILRQMTASAGGEPLMRITRKAVAAGIDRRRETPHQARHYLDTLRGLYAWAIGAELVASDPTAGLKPPRRPRGSGFVMWTADDVARFEARWPRGTRERVAFDVLRFTGLRRGDAVRLGRPHVRAGIISIQTEKTGEWVTIAVAPELAATLERGPIGELTYIAGERGRPMAKESFGNWFAEACRSARVTKSAHGLRKLFATQLAERGATTNELEAACGWRGGRMASHYTEAANRERLGLAASQRLGTDTEQKNPSPVSANPSPKK